MSEAEDERIREIIREHDRRLAARLRAHAGRLRASMDSSGDSLILGFAMLADILEADDG